MDATDAGITRGEVTDRDKAAVEAGKADLSLQIFSFGAADRENAVVTARDGFIQVGREAPLLSERVLFGREECTFEGNDCNTVLQPKASLIAEGRGVVVLGRGADITFKALIGVLEKLLLNCL